MTLPIISGYTAVILGALQIVLMMSVGFRRGKAGIPVGDGDDEALLYKIRRHGNLTENAPIFLILLGLAEGFGAYQGYVIGLAAVFIVARLAHAIALSGPGKPTAIRAIGAFGTMLGIVGALSLLAWRLSMIQ